MIDRRAEHSVPIIYICLVILSRYAVERLLFSGGWKSRPGKESLQPVAIEAAEEVTKLSESSMERTV
jgi:hypothetical protein